MRAEETPIERRRQRYRRTVIDHAHPVRAHEYFSEQAGAQMWDMLRYVVTSGTVTLSQITARCHRQNRHTSANKDVWFMGATRQLACGVWIGYESLATWATVQPAAPGAAERGARSCGARWKYGARATP
jgi:membrane peptidoglycan carboxypeptidase